MMVIIVAAWVGDSRCVHDAINVCHRDRTAMALTVPALTCVLPGRWHANSIAEEPSQ